MFETLKNAWKLPDLKRRICFTLMIIVIFRFGAALPVPFLDASVMQGFGDGNLLGFLNMLTGGAFQNATLFALSISPYITASIVVQLLAVAIPALEQMAKEGAEGRKRLNKISRYVTIGLSLIQSFGYYQLLNRRGAVVDGGNAFGNFLLATTIILMFTAGSMICVWLGEQIDEKGIGNGISMILFAGIVSRLPDGMHVIFQYLQAGTVNILNVILFAVIALAMIVFVVAISQGIRKIPVQYAKRVVGRKMYGGHTSYIPLKVNQAGVIPIIFASSVLMFPVTIGQFVDIPWVKTVAGWFAWGTPLQTTLYVLMILFFNTAVSVNIAEMSDNIKKYGGFIPGLRPGKPTTDYLDKIMSRITLAGAIFLALIALMPNVVGWITGIEGIYFGGTALLIVVGVALDTMKQVESLVLMRHYQGFMK